jgi:putative methionine-R-sulfoxide reductase with GAF domain
VSEPNSFGNPEFLKNLEFINDQLSKTDLDQNSGESQARSDAPKVADALAAAVAEGESRLNQQLEQACLATGATGAAIALVRGEKIVCHATAGPDAPDIGVCLDLHNGLSGSCIQTRHLQQCNDTETDSRVDPEASRTLGVRSIVVLPLIEGDKLFGIFEVLSSRPNAFGQRDLDTLQALTDRIVKSRSQNWESTATVPPKEFAPFAHKMDEVVQDRSSKLDAAIPRREHISRKTDLLAAALGVLVIASALLLGTLVGWRLGWQNATLALRASSPRYRASARSKPLQNGRTMSLGNELPPSSAGTDECGQSVAAGPQTQPPSDGLTVCQEGQVIFRLPASAPLPTRDLRTAQHSLGLQADPQRR